MHKISSADRALGTSRTVAVLFDQVHSEYQRGVDRAGKPCSCCCRKICGKHGQSLQEGPNAKFEPQPSTVPPLATRAAFSKPIHVLYWQLCKTQARLILSQKYTARE
eukprot:326070-Amphidinium_carterae.4